MLDIKDDVELIFYYWQDIIKIVIRIDD